MCVINVAFSFLSTDRITVPFSSPSLSSRKGCFLACSTMDQYRTKVFKNQNESETIIFWRGQEGTGRCNGFVIKGMNRMTTLHLHWHHDCRRGAELVCFKVWSQWLAQHTLLQINHNSQEQNRYLYHFISQVWGKHGHTKGTVYGNQVKHLTYCQ